MGFIDWVVRIAKAIVKGREIGLYSEKDKLPTSKLNKPADPSKIKGIKP